MIGPEGNTLRYCDRIRIFKLGLLTGFKICLINIQMTEIRLYMRILSTTANLGKKRFNEIADWRRD